MRNIAMDKETMKGSGDADRSFRNQEFPWCECGRRHVIREDRKCVFCVRERKQREKEAAK